MMDNNEKHKSKMEKPEANLIVPKTVFDPEGGPIYNPAIGTGAFWGALVGVILIGALAWLLASGAWPVVGLGQLPSGSYGAAAFLGFLIGSFLGGLTGSYIGRNKMFHEYRKSYRES